MKQKSLLTGAVALIATLSVTTPTLAQDRPELQHFRPHDQQGVNVFEAPKENTVPFDGLAVQWGAAFAQQYQALNHENRAQANVVDGIDLNRPVELGPGFNLATANLYLGAQLAEGLRVNLTTYLSSRHHPEAWVKEGYVLVDRIPGIRIDALDRIMEYVTVKAGHFEINYGDGHFRRTDNGHAMHNPFVGNYVLDAFTTEIGGEVYVRTPGGLLAMAGVTGGEINGAVTRPDDRSPSLYGKLGVDRRLGDDSRLRLTGSVYTTSASLNNTLYSGDRAGSRYYLVLENARASTSSNFTSGRLNPGFRDEVTSFMLNPFVKYGGLELFGILERSEGRAANETATRTWDHLAGEAVYRFLDDESLYVGTRLGTVRGELAGSGIEAGADRIQVTAGWFVTRNLELKTEYVRQTYDGFPDTDIRHGGEFDGLMIEGVLAF